jgi:hypothetical protein
MASSPNKLIPVVLDLLLSLKPKRVLDVGKGFGKYGLLIHEYMGLDFKQRPDPNRGLARQSSIVIDAIECNGDYLWPHVSDFYREVFHARMEDIYASLTGYDVVLLVEVIEHIPLDVGKKLLQHFVEDGASVIVATPRKFFRQILFESSAEDHVSFWPPREVTALGKPFDYMPVGPSWVYLICDHSVRGPEMFGHAWPRRARRLAKAVRDELLHF